MFPNVRSKEEEETETSNSIIYMQARRRRILNNRRLTLTFYIYKYTFSLKYNFPLLWSINIEKEKLQTPSTEKLQIPSIFVRSPKSSVTTLLINIFFFLAKNIAN